MTTPAQRVRAIGRLFGDRDMSWAFAAVWLIFLAYPLTSLLTSHKSVLMMAYGLVVIAAFVTVYIRACMVVMPFGPSTLPTQTTALAYTAVLVALAAASIPALSEACLSFGPYLMAMVVFGLDRRVGTVTVVAIIAAAFAAQGFIPGWGLDSGTMLTLVIVGLVMLVARALQSTARQREAAEVRSREADEQLAVVAERERVARDVHDILGHSLTVITLKSELAGRLIDLDPERAKVELAELHSMSRQALAEIRSTVGGLRTPDLRTELASARTALTAAEIDADLPTHLAEITPSRGALFAWVLRESVTNVVRHSGASRCAVDVDDAHIEVVDDGRGIPEHAFGNGLRGLTERVEAAGGQLSVRATGAGTAVRVTVG